MPRASSGNPLYPRLGRASPLTPGFATFRPPFAAEANALFARMSTPPTAARRALINNLVTSLKTAGAWSKLDLLYFLGAADSQAAGLNWINSGFTLSPTLSPTFTADRGYVSDGLTSFLNTTYTPATNAVQTALNSVCIGVYINQTAADVGAAGVSIGASDLTTGGGLAVGPWRTAGGIGTRANDGGGSAIGSVATRLGLSVMQRTAAGAREVFRNGLSLGTDTQVSVALTTQPIWICANNNNGVIAAANTDRVAAAFVGASLTAAQHLATYNAVSAYLTGIGGN